ncbi:hypothetical protein O0L34_g19224 [Tuta absoluta]|nr:hypothetical protein O0L34_g19224 [Tuta absoluta]
MYALNKPPNNNDTPRRERQLSFISQFCKSIEYVKGKGNAAADWLSRIEEITCPKVINFEQLAVDQQQDNELKQLRKQSNLKFVEINLPTVSRAVTCELSTQTPRPYLPEAYRLKAFNAQHEMSHPGVRTSRKIISSKYFWPAMNRDIGVWAKTCIPCQRVKVNRHSATPLGEFPQSQRFEHCHIDVVGPLPLSNECRYIVTMIDRFTGWPEAVPVREITAEVIAKALFDTWIARFGCPLRITTDQGAQFESKLFQCLVKKIGIQRIRTTAYHPQANAKVERFHRSLKAALMANDARNNWTEKLPVVLLGLRTAIRTDNNMSPTLLLYGSQVRVPSDFFIPSKLNDNDAEFVRKLTSYMALMQPIQRPAQERQSFIHKDLNKSTHVFVRNDAVRAPLIPPYDGPYEVIQRYEKSYKIQLPSRTTIISMDRLKPVYIINDEIPTTNCSQNQTATVGTDSTNQTKSTIPSETVDKIPYVTKSGRVSKRTVRYALNN